MDTNLGLAIKVARVSAHFTSARLAQRVQVSPEFIGRIESGSEPVSNAFVEAVARALDMPVWALKKLAEQKACTLGRLGELGHAQKELIKAALAIRHGGD